MRAQFVVMLNSTECERIGVVVFMLENTLCVEVRGSSKSGDREKGGGKKGGVLGLFCLSAAVRRTRVRSSCTESDRLPK